MAVSTTCSMAGEMVPTSSDGALGGAEICCKAMLTGVSPSKGTRPVSISYMTTPTLYMSLAAVTSSPRACSGEK